ncbi:MAG: HPr family phosphocarrier protein [Gemmatimonadales bacterium]|jgi:phosphocarrier protein|nr:HPr family phosphocarrier protein [Gemmatimonadales bacterium]
MIEREVTIVNQLGMHARPAAQVVRTASAFAASVELVRDGMAVNAKSIMGVMMLAAEQGSTLVVRADGADAAAAVQALADLVAGGFGEE